MPPSRVIGMLRVRDEEDLVADALDHMAAFSDGGVFVYDDVSTDRTAEIASAHPAVLRVIRGESWDADRERAEWEHRAALLSAAREVATEDDWLVYLDADERVEYDWSRLSEHPPDVVAVRMRLFDFHITPEDVNRPWPERRRIGPEYRPIVIAFRNRPGLAYRHPDQREVELGPGGRILDEGSVRHYGKALSIERWERKCDYYARSFPKYAAKWEARRGRAVHERSDFDRPLISWNERETGGILLPLVPERRLPLRVLLTNHHLLEPAGSETFTLTLASRLVARGHRVTVYSKFVETMEDALRRAGASVVSDLDAVKQETFDVAHVHHNVGAMEVRFTFPDLPIVFLSHGVLPFLESAPAVDPGIARFLAVSEEVRDRLAADGVPEGRLSIFRNLVDEARFAPGPPLPERPRRALVLSHRLDDGTARAIRDGCRAAGVSCFFAGRRFVPVPPEDLPALLRDADVVFSLGRGAIEAMLAGRIPFVLDHAGGDGLLAPDLARESMRTNFSGRGRRLRFSAEEIAKALSRWRPEDGLALRDFALAEFGAGARLDALEGIYLDAIDDRSVPRPDDAALRVIRAIAETARESAGQAHNLWARRAATGRLPAPRPREAPDAARIALAERLVSAGWLGAAREIVEGLLAADLDRPDPLALMALLGATEGAADDAAALAEHVLAADPGNRIAREALTRARS